MGGDEGRTVVNVQTPIIPYGAIILLVHSFKLERTELDADGLKAVFPAYRVSAAFASEATLDPITDQVTECAGQAPQ